MPTSYLGQKIFLSCDKFVTVSDYISSQIAVKTAAGKVTRVYNPVDSHMASAEEIRKRIKSFRSKPLAIGYIANITAQKNPQIFVICLLNYLGIMTSNLL